MAAERLHHLLGREARRRHRADAERGWSLEHHRRDALRMVKCEVQRDRTAERRAHDMSALEAERIHRRDDSVRQIGERLAAAKTAGIARQRLVVDPGFGFGKTAVHNLQLLRKLDSMRAFGVPVMAGLSRKSLLGRITGRRVNERQAASVAAALLAVERGAALVRVHDVAATRDALQVLSAVNDPDYRFNDESVQ